MVTIVRECNYAGTDSADHADRFNADYLEAVTIRQYLLRSGDIPVMIRKLRAQLVKDAFDHFYRGKGIGYPCDVCTRSIFDSAHTLRQFRQR